ncbi:acyl-CoA/acyl-ACP dehydrogenase [Salicibibacter cibarius]|uniref:Acyl-CoA/acyl-ACP dehydrogenase n=1 Tax=Salicibibacter cibarius TaxID=2743000 RepID=A0A7T6Z7I6_9BACI|nr:acyl-CoA/acyl-ACP dehydrogenase [Salicibibacter cibarius]
MDFALNEDQEMFQTSTRQYLKSKGGLEIPRRYMDGEVNILQDMWHGLAQQGYLGVNVSESYGGLGQGSLSLVPILEEMGRAIIPGPYPETMAVAVPLLEAYGTDEQKEKYLPEIVDGKRKLTLALHELNGEIAPANIQLTASEGDGDYTLNGTKILIPHGDVADTLIVPVRTGGIHSEYGISLLLVDREDANVKIQEQQSLEQTRKIVRIAFEETKVAKQQLLGPKHAGWGALQFAINDLHVALCSMMVGGIDRVVEMANEYGQTRMQFGQPIGRFQSIKHRIVDMRMDLESSRSLTYYAAWALENNADDMVEAIALARSFTSEAFVRTASDNVQIHGGMGFTWEFDCHLFLKRARALENYLGSSDDCLEIAAGELGW